MGRGPTALIERFGLPEALESSSEVRFVEAPDPAEPEIARTFAVARALSREVQSVAASGKVPLVLAGNCNSCLGTTAGLGGRVRVVWFDAHADFDTPEDNLSGFLDVMGMAMLTGACWRALRRSIPDFREIPEGEVALVGVRDLEPYQRARLDSSAVRTLYAEGIAESSLEETLPPLLSEFSARRRDVYVHVDLDVLDLEEGRANRHASSGGLSLEELTQALRFVGQVFNIRGAAITAYDPACDPRGKIGKRAVLIARTIEGGLHRAPG